MNHLHTVLSLFVDVLPSLWNGIDIAFFCLLIVVAHAIFAFFQRIAGAANPVAGNHRQHIRVALSSFSCVVLVSLSGFSLLVGIHSLLGFSLLPVFFCLGCIAQENIFLFFAFLAEHGEEDAFASGLAGEEAIDGDIRTDEIARDVPGILDAR